MGAVTIKTGNSKKQQVLKALLLTAGTICLVLGAIGIFVPLIPATPFLLISAACYMRSSERMYTWLINNRWCGTYIKNYREGKGIPLKTKIIAIAFLWAAILYSTIMVVNEVFIAQLVLFIIACAVSIHLVRIPTFKRTCKVD